MEGYVRRVKVEDSSQIDEVCYDITALKLRVSFNTGASYVYHKVPASVFGELVSALSIGKFFAKYVRDQYTTERIGK